MWVVVPVKDLATAKQRLAGTLTPAQRCRLMSYMVRDVLHAIAGSASVTGLAVVSSDPDVKRLAEQYGARLIPEPVDGDLCTATTHAARLLGDEGIGSVMIIPADVPLLTSDIVGRFVATHHHPGGLTVAPALRDGGTNALAMSPPLAIELAYGRDSFRRHCANARAVGIEPVTIIEPELALDIDTVDDLRDLLQRPTRCTTQQYLHESGIAKQLMRAAHTSLGQAAEIQTLQRSSR